MDELTRMRETRADPCCLLTLAACDFEAVAELINLPDDHVIAMFVAIGKGIKKPWSRGGQLAMDEIVVHDRF